MLIGDFDNVPNMLLEMNANTKKYFKCLPIIILSHLNVSHIHILGSIRNYTKKYDLFYLVA